MGDDDFVIETTKTFAPMHVSKYKRLIAYTNEEWELLYEQAHKIKPNLQYMGMDRVHNLLLDIEEQAKLENVSDDLGEKLSSLALSVQRG